MDRSLPNDSQSNPHAFLSREWFLWLAVVVSISGAIVWIETIVFGQGRPQGYPDRPIKVVVPFGEGGSTNRFARKMKQAVEENDLLPVPLVIINKPGAGATIGSRHVKDREPDGYTILVLHDTMFTAKAFGTVEYGAEAFQPVAATGENGMVIAVNEDSPYESLGQLMNDVAARPNEVTYGNNTGALVQFAALYLAKLQNEKSEKPSGKPAAFRLVQSGGGAKRFEDLHGKRVDVSGFSVDEFYNFKSAGIRGLAYLGARPHPAFVDKHGRPNVPTATEQGYDLLHKNTVYWWFPKGTPDEYVEVIADAFEKAMQSKTMTEYMESIQAEPIVLRGEELVERIRHSEETYSSVSLDAENPLPNIPTMLISAIAILVLAVVVEASLTGRWAQSVKGNQADNLAGRAHGKRLAWLSAALTLIYVATLSFQIIDFRMITTAFAFVTGTLLAHRIATHRTMSVVSLALSLVVYYAFTHLFVIDMP